MHEGEETFANRSCNREGEMCGTEYVEGWECRGCGSTGNGGVSTAGDPELYITPDGGHVCQRVRTTKDYFTQKEESVFERPKAVLLF